MILLAYLIFHGLCAAALILRNLVDPLVGTFSNGESLVVILLAPAIYLLALMTRAIL